MWESWAALSDFRLLGITGLVTTLRVPTMIDGKLGAGNVQLTRGAVALVAPALSDDSKHREPTHALALDDRAFVAAAFWNHVSCLPSIA